MTTSYRSFSSDRGRHMRLTRKTSFIAASPSAASMTASATEWPYSCAK